MLQADEIIQQKKWHELNAEEKAIVAELADNEAEFNLLKKMLMVSAEAVEEVPEISTSVHQALKATLPALKKKPSNRLWYTAAAAILAIVAATFFILEKENKTELVKVPETTKETGVPVTKNVRPSNDSVAPLVKKDIPAPPPAKISPAPKPVFPSLKDSMQNNYAIVETRVNVSTDPALLNLVTEVE